MRVLLICVSYNTPLYINNYLNSIEKSYLKTNGKCDLDVYVCENGNKFIDIFHDYKFHLNYFKNKSNSGYFGGIYDTILNYKIKEDDYDYIIFSNVDLEMEESFLSSLQDIVIENDVVCLSPSIINVKNRRDNNPWKENRYSKTKLKLLTFFTKYKLLSVYLYFIKHVFIFFKIKKKVDKTNRIIYGTHGCFFLFKSKKFRFDFVFPYANFLFGEELVVSEEFKKRNLKTIYIPILKIYDQKNGAISLVANSKRNLILYKSIKYILKKYY